MFEIGNSLREARLRRQIDLVDAEDATKIRSKYLSALETEDFDVLPGAVFARGFLRTYSHYLGLDSQLYIDEYNARFGQFQEVEEPAPGIPVRRRRRRVFNLRNLTILSLIAIAGLSWLGLRAEPRESAQHDRAIDSMQEQTPVAEPAAEPRRPVVATPAAPTQARLVVAATRGDSWIEVRRGSAAGPVLFAGTLEQGQKKGFKGPRLVANIGYPSAVELNAAGKKIVPTTSDALRFVVTPGGIKQLG